MTEDCNRDGRFEALRKEFVNEFQRTREIAHRLVDDLTAISGYAEIMMMRGGPEQPILRAQGKSLIALRNRWLSCEVASPICKNWDGDIHSAANSETYKNHAIGCPTVPLRTLPARIAVPAQNTDSKGWT